MDCLCAYVVVLVWLMFVHVCEKVMFEVYGGESESMSDQYRIFDLFLAIIKHIAFQRMTASMLTFLVISNLCNTRMQRATLELFSANDFKWTNGL